MTTDTAPVIEAHGLIKSFGRARALDGLDLTVQPGAVAGFLGPNGAGKSTTIRVLLGLLRADSGRVKLFDGDPWRDAVRLHRRLAYVPGETSLWPSLSGGETIDLLGRLHGRLDERRKAELIERFELDPTKKVRAYSKGNRQKVALVAAFATDAELFILDEPTAGLDPVMEAVFTSCVREVKAAGASVLLSSHILAEVEKLCDVVTIIRAGKVMESGTLAELRHLTRTRVELTTARDNTALAALAGVHDFVPGAPTRFTVDNDRLPDIIGAIGPLGVGALVCAPPSLEDLFLRYYGDELAADGATGRA
ncbi:MAG: ABC transporter ATP-binding protein [Actinomycetia bacterium]|nr:ABC transporter ATP-binding protein [Actinomycetes bacterium]